jgi:hypothetical protein
MYAANTGASGSSLATPHLDSGDHNNAEDDDPSVEPPLTCRVNGDGSATYEQPRDGAAAAMAELWRAGALADVALVVADGSGSGSSSGGGGGGGGGSVELCAHRVVLAAAAGFFRALFAVRCFCAWWDGGLCVVFLLGGAKAKAIFKTPLT